MAAIKKHNPANVSAPVGNYTHGLEVSGQRMLFISGQIPERPDGSVPNGFEAQALAVWQNIQNILQSAGMGFEHLVKVNTFLTRADQVDQNGKIRQRILGDARPALTVVIAHTLVSKWLLEIEAIAVD